MNPFINTYMELQAKIDEIKEKIAKTDKEIDALSNEKKGDIPARIQTLESVINKIDRYLPIVKDYQAIAKKYVSSLNVQTIAAPEGYRVNLNRLKMWSQLIDPMSPDDPYAQRVLAVAKCDELFLKTKKEEFQKTIDDLRQKNTRNLGEEINKLQARKKYLNRQILDLIEGKEFGEFIRKLNAETALYWHSSMPEKLGGLKTADRYAIGAFCYKTGITTDVFSSTSPELASSKETEDVCCFDSSTGSILIPYTMSLNSEILINIICDPRCRSQLDLAIRNILVNMVDNYADAERKTYIIDTLRMSSASIGAMKKLEGSIALANCAKTSEEADGILESIISTFADYDDYIKGYDSVAEYNKSCNKKDRLPLTTLIVLGCTNEMMSEEKRYMEKIISSYEKYGLTLILCSYSASGKSALKLSEYAEYNSMKIVIRKDCCKLSWDRDEIIDRNFFLYSYRGDVSDSYIASLKEREKEQNIIGNEYSKRYSFSDVPEYTRKYTKIELPFGIDSKDEAHSISFEDENFATYLVGASRSGKSTLLHTLIAGLIRNYHPDNVELWLPDFKQLEFKRYIKHLPPHVKYILLDESTELVFDLVDRLNSEMLERQQIFSRLGVQRINQIDPVSLSKPMPVIFVILDEFSIMSQSIAESPVYKLKLQNILAKGAALGIKFLFSSQTFTTGVAGLSATARAQIQQRIAMKGSASEISETLELSSSLRTEQVKNWMDALPPHYALVKFRTGPDTPPQVKRFYVMYIRDYDMRDMMIDNISSSMKTSETYKPTEEHSYVDKHPVLVDGNSFDGFDDKFLLEQIKTYRVGNRMDDTEDDKFISFGTPRLMTKMKLTYLSAETRENILLIARTSEQNCAASVILSAIRSYCVQKADAEIWAYSKNRLYRTYKNVFGEQKITFIEDFDAICDAIAGLKKAIQDKEQKNKLIVMIGIDRICMDFDFVDSTGSGNRDSALKIEELRKEFIKNGAVVSTDEEEQKLQFSMAWNKRRRELKSEATKAGKSPDEIKAYLSDELIKFRDEYDKQHPSSESDTVFFAEEKQQEYVQPTQPVNNESKSEETAKKGGYNASDDLLYILKQGSRLGYHFMILLNNFSDLKQCRFKSEFFRYKLAFQMSVDDSRELFGNKIASTLPEHICQFDDSLDRYSFRPYIHKGIGWDGWYADEMGKVISPFIDSND